MFVLYFFMLFYSLLLNLDNYLIVHLFFLNLIDYFYLTSLICIMFSILMSPCAPMLISQLLFARKMVLVIMFLYGYVIVLCINIGNLQGGRILDLCISLWAVWGGVSTSCVIVGEGLKSDVMKLRLSFSFFPFYFGIFIV